MKPTPNGPFYLRQPEPGDDRPRNAFGILIGFGQPTIVKTTSHRSREKLTRLIGKQQNYYSWQRQGTWQDCPPEMLAQALQIKGIKRAKWKDDLRRCIDWGFPGWRQQ